MKGQRKKKKKKQITTQGIRVQDGYIIGTSLDA